MRWSESEKIKKINEWHRKYVNDLPETVDREKSLKPSVEKAKRKKKIIKKKESRSNKKCSWSIFIIKYCVTYTTSSPLQKHIELKITFLYLFIFFCIKKHYILFFSFLLCYFSFRFLFFFCFSIALNVVACLFSIRVLIFRLVPFYSILIFVQLENCDLERIAIQRQRYRSTLKRGHKPWN